MSLWASPLQTCFEIFDGRGPAGNGTVVLDEPRFCAEGAVVPHAVVPTATSATTTSGR